MNKRKELEIVKSRRSTRKRCYGELGEIRFDFFKDDAILKYKYISGEKLSKKEWKKCLGKNMPISFAEWEEFVQEKYDEYSKEQLKEFCIYLETLSDFENYHKAGQNLIYAAMLSAFFSATFSGIFSVVMSTQIRMISFLIMIILPPIFVTIMGIIYLVLEKSLSPHVDQRAYNYYQEIIKSIIEKK